MPFGPYKDFDDCVRKNQDKRNPEAYCGSIQDKAEKAITASVDDGTIVRALAVGWDGRLTDGSDWSIDRSDLPLLTTQIGTLVVSHVADLDYDQYVVNGIPVDPATIQAVSTGGLVASVCEDCGLPRRLDLALVAAGVEKVPRDPAGKWCKGAQCQGGGEVDDILDELLSENPKPLTAGQKAAATKKANLEAKAAIVAEQQKASLQTRLEIESGLPVSNANEMSDEMVDAYITRWYPTKGPPAGSTAEQRKAFVKEKNVTHMMDRQRLMNDLGYAPTNPKGPVENRRAVLRETGMRKPTGGPKNSTAHEFYTDDQINGMSKEKLQMVVHHHTGGTLDTTNMDDQTLRGQVKLQNAGYRQNVALLQEQGYADEQIPHGFRSSTAVVVGKAPGFQGSAGKYGPTVAAHGPNVVPKAQVIHNAIPTAAVTPKPTNWGSMSPGQKAAWTKKHGGVKKIETTIPHPGDWNQMTSGQKAAWTKKHKVGGIGATFASPLGEHTTEHFADNWAARSAMSKHISTRPAMEGGSAHSARYNNFYSATQHSDPDGHQAWINYTGSGYVDMNGYLRSGKVEHYTTAAAMQKQTSAMRGTFKHATTSPPYVERGKANSRTGWPEFQWKIGDEFEDKGFMSTGVSRSTSTGFGDGSYKAAYLRIKTNGHRSIPGTSGEKESIFAPGTRYRVLSIKDFEADEINNQFDGATGTYVPTKTAFRYIELEIVHSPV